MGYTTDFDGAVEVTPPLNAQEVEFLNKFSATRRMNRHNGPYYVEGGGFGGQDREDDIIDYNQPPPCQPGLWCQWVVSEDGRFIQWDGGEKFYCSAEWMAYIIEHFLADTPVAAAHLPFLTGGHTVNGVIEAFGEDPEDRWRLKVTDNTVETITGTVTFEDDPQPEPSVSDERLAAVRVHLKQVRESWDKQVQNAPHLNVSRETFEILLRDLEEASGIR